MAKEIKTIGVLTSGGGGPGGVGSGAKPLAPLKRSYYVFSEYMGRL